MAPKPTPLPAGDTALPGDTVTADLNLFVDKMKREGLDRATIATFSHFYRQLRSGHKGMIPEASLDPVRFGEVQHYSALAPFQSSGRRMLPLTAMIKLNGGLGTTMGCNGPKSLIPVKNDLTFLDISIRHILLLRREYASPLPFILMNSFNTDRQTGELLATYPELSTGLPPSFLQQKFPKVRASSMQPARYPAAPHLEWNPPGHGDIFTAIASSGILDLLLKNNYRYAFISNIDNLGAGLDVGILGYMAEKSLAFLMEVAERTPMDRKGGHIARLKSGQLVLREAAQCQEEDLNAFHDINRYCFFNTNNLWIDLVALKNLLNQYDDEVFILPMICNRKNLDPVNPDSPLVFQLESAMGSAIARFSPSAVLQVPRSRFLPVKTCEDLLLIRSDACSITDDYRIDLVPGIRPPLPTVSLDRSYYTTVDQLSLRFPFGAPSLRKCDGLIVKGDVFFGRNVAITGKVTISNTAIKPFYIPDDSRIDGNLDTSPQF